MILQRNRYYIVAPSGKYTDGEVIYPVVPKSIRTNHGEEDGKTERVSLFPSIRSSLESFKGQNLRGAKMDVFTVIGLRKESLVEPEINQLPEKDLTGEIWSIAPIKVKFLTKIQVGDLVRKDYYTYGPKAKKGELNIYKWKEIDYNSVFNKKKKDTRVYEAFGKEYNTLEDLIDGESLNNGNYKITVKDNGEISDIIVRVTNKMHKIIKKL